MVEYYNNNGMDNGSLQGDQIEKIKGCKGDIKKDLYNCQFYI